MADANSLGLFNAAWYLARNPDVADAVRLGLITAEQHFRLFGTAEGRAPGPLFNPADYLAANPDVADAVRAGLMSAYDHFTQFGAGEGRSPTNLFDPDFYLAQNPDVAAAVAAGLMTATEHFLLFGQAEPRQINPFINLGAYMAANADLAVANAEGIISPLAHLLTYGAAEGRDLGNGISLGLFANDPAFQEAIGSGQFQNALERVQEVAPFLPGFQPPAGWQPPADTPIPTDFMPPEGTKLVIPPSVAVPPDTELPDIFEPVTPPDADPKPAPQPAPAPAPQPGGGDSGGGDTGGGDSGGDGGSGGSASFDVKLEGGVLSFVNGSGDISFTTNGSIATFSRGAAQAATKADLDDVSKIRLTAGQTLTATAAQITGRSVDGAGTVMVTELESTLDADLSQLTAATVTATYVLRGDGQSAPPAFVGNIGNAKLVVSAEKANYMGVSADFREAGFRLGGDASLEILAPGGIEIGAEALSGKTVTGNGTLGVLAHGANAAGLDTRHVAESIFLGITFTADADISANTQLVNVDGYRTMSPSELNTLPTLTLSATQASGVLILNYGNVVIKGLNADTNLDNIQSVQIDASAPMPAVKGVVSATVDLSQVNLDKLTHLEVSGTGHTIILNPDQYVKWNGKIAGAADNTIAFTNSPFTVDIIEGVINFGGPAGGDVTVTEHGGYLTFTRDGIEATHKPAITDFKETTPSIGIGSTGGIKAPENGKLLMTESTFNAIWNRLFQDSSTIIGPVSNTSKATVLNQLNTIATNGITGDISLTSNEFATTGLAAKLANGVATVDAQGVSTTEGYTALYTGIEKIKVMGGITGLDLNLNLASDDATASLLAKAVNARVSASGGSAVEIRHLVSHIANIAADGISGTLDITDSAVGDAADITALFSKYSGHASVNATDMNADKLNAIADHIAKVDTAMQGIYGTMSLKAPEIHVGNFSKLLSKYTDTNPGVMIDAAGLTDTGAIDAILTAVTTDKIAAGELRNLMIENSVFADIDDLGKLAGAVADGADALTVYSSSAQWSSAMNIYFGKGVKIMGSEVDDVIEAGGSGNHIINAGAGTDSITLAHTGSATIVFGASASENGHNNITGFSAGAAPGRDVLDFSRFVNLTGGLEGQGEPVDATFEYLTAGAAAGGTDIAGKIFLWRDDNPATLKTLIESTSSNGKLGLADGEKAVVLYKWGPLDGVFSTFNIAYITGSGNNDETIEVVGSVYLYPNNGLIDANFGIGI